MEELLNKLIEKGWKPREILYKGSYDFEFRDNGHTLVSCHSNEDDEYTNFDTYSWRDIVSKESGLWQFVCTNELLSPSNCNGARIYKANISEKFIEDRDYKYRLIVSSLQDENKLEDFLLENIKV